MLSAARGFLPPELYNRIDEVLCFEAADKYVRVLTADREHLIRTSLRELLPQLDPQRFWQVHRGTIVNLDAVSGVLREDPSLMSGFNQTMLVPQGAANLLVAGRCAGMEHLGQAAARDLGLDIGKERQRALEHRRESRRARGVDADPAPHGGGVVAFDEAHGRAERSPCVAPL